eukprot:gene3854-4454_t
MSSSHHAPYCGSTVNPCQSIKDGVRTIVSKYSPSRGLKFVINVKKGFSVIDCGRVSYGVSVNSGSNFKLVNFIISNCVGIEGGGFSSYNSTIQFENVKFYSNYAEYGAGAFIYKSMFDCIGCTLTGNTANQYGSGVYLSTSISSFSNTSLSCNLPSSYADSNYDTDEDIYQFNSKSTFSKSNTTLMGVRCDGSSELFSSANGKFSSYRSLESLCNTVSKCKKPVYVPTSTYNVESPRPMVCNNDGSCGGHETCVNCPTDCPTCQFQGVAFSLFNTEKCAIINGTTVSNGSCIYDNYPTILKDFARIRAISPTDKRTGAESTHIQPFFSQGICKDGIVDRSDTCEDTGILGIDIANTKCGDSICNETPEDCLKDCYHVLGSKCSSQVDPIKNDIPLTDTLAYLLNNQYRFSVPGLSHLSHGVDFFTFDELASQIFDTSYCNNITYSTLQDIYRFRVYNVPPEFYAESLPLCTYDSDSRVFKSHESYKTQMVEETMMSISAGVSANFNKFGGSANFAMSRSSSVDTARKMERDDNSMTVSTTVKCISTTVTRNTARFHENFVKDISLVETPLSMSFFIERYGALYYESASLGGSLEMLVSVHSSSSVERNEKTIKKQSEISAGASFTTPYGGAGMSYSGSDDSEISQEQQRKFEASVSKSNVFVKGGALGSFGPDSNAPSSFGDWAKSVDLRPVPINPKLKYIGAIIPSAWTVTTSNESCVLYQNKCSIYNESEPYNCVLQDQSICKVTESNPCSNYTTCLTYQQVEHRLSVQDLWKEGFDIYLARQKTEPVKILYWFKVHFIFKVDPPATELDKAILTNLTLTFNTYPNDAQESNATASQITVSKVNITIGCSSVDNIVSGCQYTLTLKQNEFPHRAFELYNLTISTFDPLRNQSVSHNYTRYFEHIIVESTNPEYSRGFLFNLTLPYHHNFINTTHLDQIIRNTAEPDLPFPIVNPTVNIDDDNWYTTTMYNVSIFDPATGNYSKTLYTNKTTVHRSRIIPDPMPVMYPDVDRTKILFTAIDSKMPLAHEFFAVRVGELAVFSDRILPIGLPGR